MGKHKDEIHIESFSWGVADSPPGGGLPASGDLVSPADAEGHVKKATLTVRKPGGKEQDSYGEPADDQADALKAAPGDGAAAGQGKVNLQDFHFTPKTWKEGEGPVDDLAGTGDEGSEIQDLMSDLHNARIVEPPPDPQEAAVDYFLKIDGIDGESRSEPSGPSSPDGLASPPPPPQEAGYLKIGHIKGESVEFSGGVRPAVGDVTGDSSTDAADGHKDWINLESVSQNTHKPGGSSAAMGDGSARGPADALQPPPEPQEMGSHAAGGGGGAGKVQMRDFHFAEPEDGPSSLASLEPPQADTGYMTHKMEDALISSVSPSVGDADGEFPKIQWTFQDGGVQAEDSWDIPGA